MRAFTWRDRVPFGPLVVRTKRGILHRAAAGPRLHVRCAGGRPFVGDVLTPEQAVEWAREGEWVLCRYPWCFREAVRAAGIDPEVGHVIRNVYRPHPGKPAGPAPHRAAPDRPHESVAGWSWCSCDRIIFRSTRAHNPAESWWTHHTRAAA